MLNWSNNTYEVNGGSTPSVSMVELDVINLEGYYYRAITISAWPDGWYLAVLSYTGTPKRNGAIEFYVVDGVIVDILVSTKLDMSVSSRLATDNYVVPDNAGIAALPTLAEIEASTVPAKEATITTVLAAVTLLNKYVKNTKEIKVISGTKYLVIYDNDNISELIRKSLKGPSGEDISNIVAGALALENASSV